MQLPGSSAQAVLNNRPVLGSGGLPAVKKHLLLIMSVCNAKPDTEPAIESDALVRAQWYSWTAPEEAVLLQCFHDCCDSSRHLSSAEQQLPTPPVYVRRLNQRRREYDACTRAVDRLKVLGYVRSRQDVEEKRKTLDELLTFGGQHASFGHSGTCKASCGIAMFRKLGVAPQAAASCRHVAVQVKCAHPRST